MGELSDKIISKPNVLVLIYKCGYKEISHYDLKNEKFKNFQVLSEEEQLTLESMFIKDDLRLKQVIPNEVYDYLDLYNFSFIVKSHTTKLSFLNSENEVEKVDIKLPDLFFRIKNNAMYVYPTKGNVLYNNPLPNTMYRNLICLGNADKSYTKETNLSKKIELVKETYFKSTFTSYNKKDDLLKSWFQMKRINYKKLSIHEYLY